MIAFLLTVLALVGCSSEPDSLTTLYQLQIEACNGLDTQRATAVAIAPDVVATVAHSFEDAQALTMTDGNGTTVNGEIIYLDQAKDLALLRLDERAGDTLTLGEPEESGAVTIATYGESGGPTIKNGDILGLVQATLDGEGPRAAIRLEAEIKPGDSGAPVIDADGQMVGLVFATVRNKDVGWAVSATEISDVLDEIERDNPGALPLACPS